MIRRSPRNSQEIIKTFRRLPNVDDGSGYLNKPYRYLIDLEKLDIPIVK